MSKEELEEKINIDIYNKFINSLKTKKEFNYKYENKKDKVQICLYVSFCDNGVWQNDIYGSLNCNDFKGLKGFGRPFSINEEIGYDKIINMICKFLDIDENQKHDKQLSFF